MTDGRGRTLATFVPFVAGIIALVSLTRSDLSGPLAPGEVEVVRVALSAPADATVVSVDLALGAEKRAGDLAVRLSSPMLARDLETARLELARLELEVPAKQKDLVLGERSTLQELEREAAEARLQEKKLVADLERERASVRQIDEQIARQKDLIEKKLASSQGLDELLLKRASVAESVDERRALVEAARTVAETAERALMSARAGKAGQNGAADERLAPLAAAVRAQRERVSSLEDQLASLDVMTPVDARVLDVHVRPGDLVGEGALLATLVDARTPRVIVYADESWARAVEVGAHADLAPSDRRGQARTGRVVALAAAITEIPVRFRLIPAEPSFGRAIYVELDDGGAPPLPGQAFDVTFRSATSSEATR